MSTTLFFIRQSFLAYLLLCMLGFGQSLFVSLFMANTDMYQPLNLVANIQETAANPNLVALAFIYGLGVCVLKILFGQDRNRFSDIVSRDDVLRGVQDLSEKSEGCPPK